MKKNLNAIPIPAPYPVALVMANGVLQGLVVFDYSTRNIRYATKTEFTKLKTKSIISKLPVQGVPDNKAVLLAKYNNCYIICCNCTISIIPQDCLTSRLDGLSFVNAALVKPRANKAGYLRMTEGIIYEYPVKAEKQKVYTVVWFSKMKGEPIQDYRFHCYTNKEAAQRKYNEIKLSILDKQPTSPAGKRHENTGICCNLYASWQVKEGITERYVYVFADNISGTMAEMNNSYVYTVTQFLLDCDNSLEDVKVKPFIQPSDANAYFESELAKLKKQASREDSDYEICETSPEGTLHPSRNIIDGYNILVGGENGDQYTIWLSKFTLGQRLPARKPPKSK